MSDHINLESVGARIEALKEKTGAMRLCEKAGISHTQLSKLIRGQIANPGVMTLEAIAKAADEELSWILYENRVGDYSASACDDDNPGLMLSRDYMCTLGIEPGNEIFYRIVDDTMVPTLPSSSCVVANTDVTQRDGLNLVSIDDRLHIRRITRAAGNMVVICDNPQYPPQTLKSNEVRVVGQVALIIRQQ